MNGGFLMTEQKDFINDEEISRILEEAKNPDPAEIRDIFAKSKEKVRLEPEEPQKNYSSSKIPN